MESIYSFLRPIDFVVVVIYLIVLIGFGYWVSFVRNRDEDENHILVGKTLGSSSIGLTIGN